jgi:predicted alpha/beta hydrolase
MRSSGKLVLINSATGVPRRFYRHFAAALTEACYTVVTYDYRGVGDSRPQSLRGLVARVRDWVTLDMAGLVDWVADLHKPRKLFLVGHSVGGQLAGMLDNSGRIDGMLTISAQSGYWGYQGGGQKVMVWIHAYLTLPMLSRLFGYMPWSLVGGEDLPKDAALEWARWCRDPEYLLGDSTLPLERYAQFAAPVLAYSFGDDNWGTARSVDAMMRAYPTLERRHLQPADVGLHAIGHFGYFRPESKPLWDEAVIWLDEQ